MTRALAFLALVGVAVPAQAQVGDEFARARREYEAGVEAGDAGQWPEAVAHHRTALELAPSRTSVLYALAFALFSAGQRDEAVQTLDQLEARLTEEDVPAEVAAEFAPQAERLREDIEAQDAQTAQQPPPQAQPQVPASEWWMAAWIATAASGVATVSWVALFSLAADETTRFDNAPTEDRANRVEMFAVAADVSAGFSIAAGATAIVFFVLNELGRPIRQEPESAYIRVGAGPLTNGGFGRLDSLF